MCFCVGFSPKINVFAAAKGTRKTMSDVPFVFALLGIFAWYKRKNMARQAHANPFEPVRQAVSRFHRQTLTQLKMNAVTQTVFPSEVYPGYNVINEARKATGSWYSTGKGVRSFSGRIVSADNEQNITLQYSFNEYLLYAEAGVGAGTRRGDVDSSKNAHFKRRYVKKWNRRAGRSQRPFLHMELRHLAGRLERYVRDFYEWEIESRVFDILDGMKIDLVM